MAGEPPNDPAPPDPVNPGHFPRPAGLPSGEWAPPYDPYYVPGFPTQPNPLHVPFGAHGTQPQAGPTNTLAILSLILAFIVPIAGVVCGVLAKKQIRERNEQGAALATAGIICGTIFSTLTVLYSVYALIQLQHLMHMLTQLPR
jgi:uncharacterized protein DUF4190